MPGLKLNLVKDKESLNSQLIAGISSVRFILDRFVDVAPGKQLSFQIVSFPVWETYTLLAHYASCEFDIYPLTCMPSYLKCCNNFRDPIKTKCIDKYMDETSKLTDKIMTLIWSRAHKSHHKIRLYIYIVSICWHVSLVPVYGAYKFPIHSTRDHALFINYYIR